MGSPASNGVTWEHCMGVLASSWPPLKLRGGVSSLNFHVFENTQTIFAFTKQVTKPYTKQFAKPFTKPFVKPITKPFTKLSLNCGKAKSLATI